MPDLIALPSATARSTGVRHLLAGCLLSILIAGSALRSTGLFADDLYWLQEDLGGDKAVHLMAGICLMTAAWLLFLPRSGKASATLFLAVLTVMSLEELSQLTLGAREFDLFDLAAGSLGAGLLALAIAVFSCLFRQLAAVRERRPDN